MLTYDRHNTHSRVEPVGFPYEQFTIHCEIPVVTVGALVSLQERK